jgi:hypothetical protein
MQVDAEGRLEFLMQAKPSLGGAAASTGKSYAVFVSCNKCGEMHDLGVTITMTEGPVAKQSIASLYDGKTLPKIISDLSSNSVTCPKTGRQSVQKDNHHIFLVPPKD